MVASVSLSDAIANRPWVLLMVLAEELLAYGSMCRMSRELVFPLFVFITKQRSKILYHTDTNHLKVLGDLYDKVWTLSYGV